MKTGAVHSHATGKEWIGIVGDAKCEWDVMPSWMPPIGLLLSHLSRLSDCGERHSACRTCCRSSYHRQVRFFKVVPADSLPISSARQMKWNRTEENQQNRKVFVWKEIILDVTRKSANIFQA
ncbi:uncharacterized protein [Drosophila takahashii]|uniref:uncharacterized protein isoform X2 n=1 Tax=Drosophila takahashii TaxID=29030 RepID=UPI0038995C20